MLRCVSIFLVNLLVLLTGSCVPMKPLMNNQELVIELRLELNKEFLGRSKEESAKLPKITVNDNVMWIVREGYPQFRIYGLSDEEARSKFINRVQEWLNKNPDFEVFFLEFYSNKGELSKWPVLQLEKKLKVEGLLDG